MLVEGSGGVTCKNLSSFAYQAAEQRFLATEWAPGVTMQVEGVTGSKLESTAPTWGATSHFNQSIGNFCDPILGSTGAPNEGKVAYSPPPTPLGIFKVI